MQHQREFALAYFEKRNAIGMLLVPCPMIGNKRQVVPLFFSYLFGLILLEQDVDHDTILTEPRLKLSQSNLSGLHELTLANHHLPLSGLLPYSPIKVVAHSAESCTLAGSKATSSLVTVTATAKAKAIKAMRP